MGGFGVLAGVRYSWCGHGYVLTLYVDAGALACRIDGGAPSGASVPRLPGSKSGFPIRITQAGGVLATTTDAHRVVCH